MVKLLKKNHTKSISRAAVIGALYFIFTVLVYPLSYGAIQFRLSEAFCILPLFFPEAVYGLTVGCLLSNVFSAVNPLLDIPLGTTATLLASLSTYLLGKKCKHDATRLICGILPAVLFNALIVPFSIYAVSELKEMYLICALQVGFGELSVLCALGIPLYFIIKNRTKNGELYGKRRD